jgi:MoaA/NifB/PqqE/SkfB family radical SAM enzyme
MGNRFKKVYIEITNTCNLNCDFCPGTTRKNAFMDKDSFTHIINQVSPFTNHVYFHLMGEPLLHPLLSDFLSICCDKNLKVIITSNGTLIEKTKSILLSAKALHKINFFPCTVLMQTIMIILYQAISQIL